MEGEGFVCPKSTVTNKGTIIRRNARIRHLYCSIKERRRPPIREQSTTLASVLDFPPDTPPWLTAVRAAESKKATDIRVLDLHEITSFADYFIICTGANPRQIQAISEEIGIQLAKYGDYPVSVEGFHNADWILADYGDYLVHVFSEKARSYYDLERLWRHARDVPVPPE